jgi:hypothetical protein
MKDPLPAPWCGTTAHSSPAHIPCSFGPVRLLTGTGPGVWWCYGAHSPRLSPALEVSMDADRFDALTQALARTTRRGALGVLAGAALDLLYRETTGATHTGCLHHGSRCKHHIQCCSGKCSHKHRCKCPRGTTKCGETECCRNADQQCCTDTCASATLTPEGGSCPGDASNCCPGMICTPSDNTCCRSEHVCFKLCCLNGTLCTDENICCASGHSCFGTCCQRADDVCTPGDEECCRPENVCLRSCCSRPDEFCDGLNCVPIVNG